MWFKNAKKTFSTCKSGDAECEMRHGILIGKFIFGVWDTMIIVFGFDNTELNIKIPL